MVRGLDGLRPALSDFLLQGTASARSQARGDLLFGAGLMAAAIVTSLLVLLSTSRSIVVPLRRFEHALERLRGGSREVPPVEVRGPAEIAAVSYAFRDILADVALLEAQAVAIAAGDLLDPVLAQTATMPIGRSLQQLASTLSRMGAQLKAREETAKAVLETAADAIWTIDSDALVRSANRATEDLLGWPASDVVGAHFGSLLATEGDMVVFELLRQQGSVRSEVQLRRANGTTIPALVSAAVTYFEGNLMVTVVARDISERKELEGRLAHQATHDTLTGLANRGAAI
ncbi:MAG: PAS domain S-box protein, partial [Acidimicrobiales bacterium]